MATFIWPPQGSGGGSTSVYANAYFGDGSDGAAILDGTNAFSWATIGGTYTFTVTSAQAISNSIYTDSNSNQFIVTTTIAGSTTLVTKSIKNPPASGTLTLLTGTGDSTIAYSSFVRSNVTYYLGREVYLTDLTINSGITLVNTVYSITGNGTLTNAGTIDCSGFAGSAAGIVGNLTGQGSGGAGGLSQDSFTLQALSLGSLGSGNIGAAGSGGTTAAAGTDGSQGNFASVLLGLDSGVTGAGGNGTLGNGGAAVTTVVPPGSALSWRRVDAQLVSGVTVIGGGVSGGGGASGGGDAANPGGGGGGGGGCGGVIAIFFQNINNTGTISSNGGAGGHGETPTSHATGVGGGGGGAGASGGFVYIITNNPIAIGSIQANGGVGGVNGAGLGTGTAGTIGTGGTSGLILKYNTSTGAWF